MHNLITMLLSEFGFNFVLTGFLQSDPLESLFGRYRQMSGGNLLMSVKQVIESEKKIRQSSILKHLGISFQRICTSSMSDESFDETLCAEIFAFDSLPDFQMTEAERQIVYFIADYCSKRVVDKIKCTKCKSFIISPSVSFRPLMNLVIFSVL